MAVAAGNVREGVADVQRPLADGLRPARVLGEDRVPVAARPARRRVHHRAVAVAGGVEAVGQLRGRRGPVVRGGVRQRVGAGRRAGERRRPGEGERRGAVVEVARLEEDGLGGLEDAVQVRDRARPRVAVHVDAHRARGAADHGERVRRRGGGHAAAVGGADHVVARIAGGGGRALVEGQRRAGDRRAVPRPLVLPRARDAVEAERLADADGGGARHDLGRRERDGGDRDAGAELGGLAGGAGGGGGDELAGDAAPAVDTNATSPPLSVVTAAVPMGVPRLRRCRRRSQNGLSKNSTVALKFGRE